MKAKYDPDRHHRRSIRLKDYDYSQEGAYFVTICTYQRQCLFGEISNGEMRLNEIGLVVRKEWPRSADIRREIHLDAFVIMPNHLHGIVLIVHDVSSSVGATGGRPYRGCQPERHSARPAPGPQKHSLALFIGGFKSACTRSINESLGTRGIPVWQRGYYDHAIRNDRVLRAIREYIGANPLRWTYDVDNPDFMASKRNPIL